MQITMNGLVLSVGLTISAPEIEKQLKAIGEIMSKAKDDLTAAVAALNASISAEIAAVAAALTSAQNGLTAQEAADVAAQLTALRTTVDTETATLVGPAPAPPAPVVAP